MIRHSYRGKGIAGFDLLLKNYPHSFLLSLYQKMLRIRRIEEAIAQKYPEDLMKTPVHLAIGQEATAVGVMEALTVKDYAFCGHRTHSVYLAKGGDLNAMLSEFHCRLNGCCGSRGGSMHLLDQSVGMMGSSAIVGGIVPIATGAALALQQKKEQRRVVVFLGDAAVEEGSIWESFNFAVLKKLPILFVCENNFYSVCSPIEYRQPLNVSIEQKARAFGLNSTSVDGNNPLEVYEATQNALRYIEEKQGPAFVEAFTYRWKGHHGGEDDYDLGYRSFEEWSEWKEKDPLQMMGFSLKNANILNEAVLREMEALIFEEIQRGFTHALSSANPTEKDLMTHVYAPGESHAVG